MSEDIELDARAATSTYVVFGTIFGFVFVVCLSTRGNPSAKIFFGMLFCVVMFLIRSYHILIKEQALTYFSPFGRKRSIRIAEIGSAKTEVGVKGPFDPVYRLVLEPADTTGERAITINMKIFRRADLARLFEILDSKMIG